MASDEIIEDQQDNQSAIEVVVPDRNYGFPRDAFDPSLLPDFDNDFLSKEDLEAFISALAAPEPTQNPEDSSTFRLGSPVAIRDSASFDVTRRTSSVAINDGPRPRLRQNGDIKGDGDGRKDDAQEVAAHAAAAAADVSAPSQPNGLDQVHRGSSSTGGLQQQPHPRDSLFITAQNDWAPVHQKIVRTGTGGTTGKKKRRTKRPRAIRPGRRTKDETREGYLYGLLKWPFLVFVGGWLLGLSAAYVLTRYYIWFYEYFISWRGRREQLRRNMRATGNYRDWRAAARELDEFLGNTTWKETNEFAYYDCKTVRRVWESMKKSREAAETVERKIAEGASVETEERQEGEKAVEALRALLTACVKNNFVGVENPRLYSQTYYGTKNLVQNHVDEGRLFFPFSFCVEKRGCCYLL